MAARLKVPLNIFKRVTKQLIRGKNEPIYTVPIDRATIFINTLAANTSNSDKTVTLATSTTNVSGSYNILLNKAPLGALDSRNLASSKIVLGTDDVFVANVDIDDLRTIDDPNALWEFDLPYTITELSGLSIGFTTGTNATADFGVGDIDNIQRAVNADFSDWSDFEESSPGSNTTIEYPLGQGNVLPLTVIGWTVAFNANSDGLPGSDIPTGTFSIKKQTPTSEEQQLFNNIYYPRLQLTNADPELTTPLDFNTSVPLSSFRYYGAGIILRSSSELDRISLGDNSLFGKQIKITVWLRASENTKVAVEGTITTNVYDAEPGFNGVKPNYGTRGNYTIFDVTTAWEKFETTFTQPTFEEYWLNARDQNIANAVDLGSQPGGINNWTYTSADPSLSSIVPLSAYNFGFAVRNYYSYRNTYRRFVGVDNADTLNVINTVNSSLITNGYYDVAGLEVFLNTGSSFVPLTSLVPVDYIYDLDNTTDSNITLSLLETANLP